MNLWCITIILLSIQNRVICWQLFVERYELPFFNYSIANVTAAIFKYNRTALAGSVYIDLYNDLAPGALGNLQAYGLYSNEYKLLPINVNRTFCEFLSREFLYLKPHIKNIGNIPDKCPLKKGFYYIKNFVSSTMKVPIQIPWETNNYRFDGRGYIDGYLVGYVKIYIRITRDDEIIFR